MSSWDKLTMERLRDAQIQIVSAKLDGNDFAVSIWAKFILDLSEAC